MHKLTMALLPIAALVAVGLMASGGRTTHAQEFLPPFDCVEIEETEFCIGLDPEFAENDAGTDHTVTAFLSTDFQHADDVVDLEVAFFVTEGPNQGAGDAINTNEFAQASFTYTGEGGAGVDIIEACVPAWELCVGAQKQWVEHRLSLTPETAINLVGTAHTVTATVTDLDGEPVEGIDVFIHVSNGPNAETEFFPCDPADAEEACAGGPTDELGQVKLTYTSDGTVGIDTIRADVCIEPTQFFCTEFLFAEASKQWVGPNTLTLTPPTDTNTVGDKHTVTATVVGSDGRVDDADVTFTVTAGPNKGDTGTDTTDADGEADFTYTGDGGAGTDTIQACVFDEVDQKDVCDTAEKTWEGVVLAATATPTPKPTPAVLPVSGGTPSDGGSSALPWLAAIAGATALIGGGSAWFAYQRRRIR